MKEMTLFLLIICISFFQCEKSTTSSDKEMESVILPLKVGNYWILEENNAYLDTISIDTVYIINNEKWYSLGTEEFLLYRNDEIGLWEAYIENDSLYEMTLFFKYPAEVNDTWIFWDSPITLLSKSESLSLFGKTYENCYKYFLDESPNIINYYLKPDIGFIQVECFLNDSLYYIWEIKEYHLNN